MASAKPYGLLCMGNPLVELHTEVPQSLLERFGLPTNATVAAEERHLPLRDLLRSSYKVEHSPGGGAATTALAVRALGRAGAGAGAAASKAQLPIALLGTVGRDDLAYKLRELLRDEDVQPLFSESEQPTGWRAVLRAERPAAGGSERPERDIHGLGTAPGEEEQKALHGTLSCATFAGAAREYKLDHLRFKVWESVEAAHVVYVDALFLTASQESAKSVAEYCAKMGNTFCLNLAAPYLCRYFHDRILALLPYTDCLLGNEGEYFALAEHRNEDWVGDLDAVVSWLARLPRADGDAGRRRQVVATCGRQPTVVASTWRGYGVKVQRYPVPPVKAGRYVCKDGAGDAFAGGFLLGLAMGADVDGCAQLALHAAHGAVQRIGPRFTFRDRPQL